MVIDMFLYHFFHSDRRVEIVEKGWATEKGGLGASLHTCTGSQENFVQRLSAFSSFFDEKKTF